MAGGSASACHFRGLLRLHSRYSPSDCSAAQGRPLSRGSSPSGHPAEPLVSYQINRQLSGWIPPPLVIRAFGAHCQNPTSGVARHGAPRRTPHRLAFDAVPLHRPGAMSSPLQLRTTVLPLPCRTGGRRPQRRRDAGAVRRRRESSFAGCYVYCGCDRGRSAASYLGATRSRGSDPSATPAEFSPGEKRPVDPDARSLKWCREPLPSAIKDATRRHPSNSAIPIERKGKSSRGLAVTKVRATPSPRPGWVWRIDVRNA